MQSKHIFHGNRKRAETVLNFEQYLSVSADLLDANCLDSFITGFRLGARFEREVLLHISPIILQNS